MVFEQTLPPIEQIAGPPDSGGRTPWGYADMAMAIGIIIGGTILLALPVAAVAAVIAGGSDIDNDKAALAVLLGANLLLELFLLVAVALFTVRKYKVSWAAVGLRLPERGGWWLPLAMLGGALMVIWVYFAVIAALGAEPSSNIPDEAFDSVPLIVLVGILSLALAPVMEETFFRGFLFGGLRGRWGFFFAALSTGFLFALAHVDPLVYIPFTAVGMIFAWGYVYSGSILASMIAHLLFNAISFGLAVS
ncbi:MAG: CPBP family intramembrane metalloprotease, partial [Dehalococcoidia bacterium]|nr:CPBP family intramembrane metalloprotease [Dehalococcoidia bacterium]